MKALKLASVEKDVENAYREAIHKERPQAAISSPYGTDGFFTWGNVRLLLEVKYDLDFKARVPVCTTLGQCVFYLKKFSEAGKPLPNVILVGDKNECFVLATSTLLGFLDLQLDWKTAPSKGNPELTRALVEGLNILPYVYEVGENFQILDVIAKIEGLAEGTQQAVQTSTSNIGAIFEYWQTRVFGDSAIPATDQVDIFLKCLFQPTDVYLHPSKLGVLVVPGYPAGIPVSTDQYRSFFSHFQQGYKPSDIEAFYASKDRLIADDARRRQGAFFTPALWVDQAHKYIEAELGPNWRDECIVWDSSAGTGNLTRDYQFKDLIISTLEKSDVDVIVAQGYNPGAIICQLDFLNDELPPAISKQLTKAAALGKRLVFLMNPPYGTANNAGTEEGDHKAGIALTAVNTAMKETKIGASSQQLYAQFMYQSTQLAKTYGFAEVTVAMYSKSTFVSSGSYKGLRDFWYKNFAYKSGFMFQASHFSDVSGRWGVAFTVWSEGAQSPKAPVYVELLDIPKGRFNVVNVGSKIFYNSDGREAAKWVREPLGKLQGKNAPQLSSGLAIKEGPGCRGTLADTSLGYLTTVANNVMKAGTDTFWTSSCSSMAHGVSVLPTNFRRAVALYAARKLVLGDWVNDKDEYLVPTISSAYEQWLDDAHIYNILHTSNNCTAMRAVTYNNTLWTIHNHFFWKSHSSAMQALNTSSTPNIYRDCKANPSKDVFGKEVLSSQDPYMASQIPKLTLSPAAQDVLAKLDALWVKSLAMREAYAAGKPELHLMAWDAGVYQLKHLWRDLFTKEWEELQVSFKALADKLRPGVYAHGFLLK